MTDPLDSYPGVSVTLTSHCVSNPINLCFKLLANAIEQFVHVIFGHTRAISLQHSSSSNTTKLLATLLDNARSILSYYRVACEMQ